MLFLVELDHVKTTAPTTPEAGRAFSEQVIFPMLARGERLISEKKIVAVGAVVGRVSLRFIIEAETSARSPYWMFRYITSIDGRHSCPSDHSCRVGIAMPSLLSTPRASV
jgi:hypothetical protein